MLTPPNIGFSKNAFTPINNSLFRSEADAFDAFPVINPSSLFDI